MSFTPAPNRYRRHFQFYNDSQVGTFQDLQILIAAMPPLHKALVKITPQKV